MRPKVRAIRGIVLNDYSYASNTLRGIIFVPFKVKCVVVLLVPCRFNDVSPNNTRLRGFRDDVIFHRRFIQSLIIQCSPTFTINEGHVRVIKYAAICTSIFDENFRVRVSVTLITIRRLIRIKRFVTKKTVIQFTDNRTRV